MVRINLISPRELADQHLVAEYLEIMMLIGYVKKYPSVEKIPEEYCLGKGHIKFFKNKLVYLKERHELIKEEMRNRGFATNKNIELRNFNDSLKNNWNPKERDFEIIKERLKWKIKNKPSYYRYYGEKKDFDFFDKLIK